MNPYTAPELAAGGFTRNDGSVEFYTRVRALLEPTAVVLDFGAGRGQGTADDPISFRRQLLDLRGEHRRVIGVDVDPVVEQNESLDEAHVLSGTTLPLESASIDLVVADWVFEHVDDAGATAAELSRVLRPGGWICARTPNGHGYVALGARLVPNRLHAQALHRLQPQRKSIDVFPTRYRMNTKRQLQELFPPQHFTHATYGHVTDPVYFGRSSLLIGAVSALSRLLPEALAPVLLVFVRKDT